MPNMNLAPAPASPFGPYEYASPAQNSDPFGQSASYGNQNLNSYDQGSSFQSNPFEPSQSSYNTEPSYQPSPQDTYPFGAQENYATNPFGPNPNVAPQQNYGNTAPLQDKGERWRDAGKAALDLGRKAVGALIKLAPSNKTANRIQGAYTAVDTMQSAMPQAQNAYNTVRQDASAAWANRNQYANQAVNLVGNAAIETGKAGLAGAGEYAMNRYGLQRDREARFGITVANKRALARGVMRTAINPQAEAARLAHGAFNAGRREATASARGQMAAARSNARGAAANYARGVF
jgi:hypothetical protein